MMRLAVLPEMLAVFRGIWLLIVHNMSVILKEFLIFLGTVILGAIYLVHKSICTCLQLLWLVFQ